MEYKAWPPPSGPPISMAGASCHRTSGCARFGAMPQISPGAGRASTQTAGIVVRAAAIGLLMCAVVAYYAWTVSPGRPLFAKFAGDSCYYNLLIKGFRSGHLSLGVPVPPALLKVKDPYDPAQGAGLGIPDVSYYKGKFYLYFGVAPALTLYWPFEALTGRYLDDGQAVFILCTVAFLAGSLLLLRARRRYFPMLGVASDACSLLAWGLATMVPVLVRRTQVYEVAISSAFAFFVLSLVALYQSMHSQRRLRWLAFASLCYGLAIASRPTYMFGAAGLLVPVWLGRAEFAGARTGRALLARACAAIIPVAFIVAGLLVYNELRFENPFQFGQDLQMAGVREMGKVHFSPSYIWVNCWAYLFARANLSAYFPFVRVATMLPGPPGYLGVEDPYGIFPNIPFVLLACFAPFACIGRPKLGALALGAAVASAAVAAVVFSFEFASNRYMVDFLPGLIVVAIIGSWWVWSIRGGAARVLARTACTVVLAWSVLFNLFASFGHNELLRANDPETFHRLAHAFGYPRFLFDKLIGRKYGPIEITVKLPKFEKAHLEPLVITGSEFLSDFLYAFYLPENKVIIAFEHTSHGGPVTKPINCDYSKPHRITVDMPPLYPPVDDPYFDGIPANTVAFFNNRLRVWLDGVPIINEAQQFYPAFSVRPCIGQGAEDQTALGRRFTGEILNVSRTAKDWSSLEKEGSVGPLVILLVFPQGNFGVHEPLVSSGITGKGDVLAVNYIDSQHVSFLLDHWGYPALTSKPVEIAPGTVQILEVRFGSFFPPSRRPANISIQQWSEASRKMVLLLNNRKVFDERAEFYAAPPGTVAVGRNIIGASTCVSEFSGQVVGYIRSDMNSRN
jgi:hypothetical protein